MRLLPLTSGPVLTVPPTPHMMPLQTSTNKVYVIGHSLGAAMATIAALRMDTLFTDTAFVPRCVALLASRCPAVIRAPVLVPRLTSHHQAAPAARGAATRSSSSSMAGAQAVGGADGYDQQWMDHWRTGVQPGQLWDAGRCSPQLDALLGTSTTSSSSSQQLQVQGKRVLVPGCGRGYDVCAFAAAGASLAVGLDLSEEAVAAARAECAARLQERALGACELVSGDFFAYTHPSGAAFDVGWDYTFLCAIEPSMRQDWAAAWARLLAPGGLLVTLMFPVGGVPASAPRRDPPWAVTPELYRELLLPAGFSEVHVGEVPHALSHAPRAGREWLGLWRRCAQAGWAGGGSSTRSTSAEGGASDGGTGGPARL